MSLKIVRESLNAYCGKPWESVDGELLMDVHVLIVIANERPTALVLPGDSVTLTITSVTGQLLSVEPAVEINGKYAGFDASVAGNCGKPLKITFRVRADLLGRAGEIRSITLDIGYDSVTCKMDGTKLLSAPEDLR